MIRILVIIFSFFSFFQLIGQNKIADALFDDFEYKLAIKYYNSPLEVVNTNFETETLNLDSRIKLALCYFRIHDYENAELKFKELCEIDNVDPIFYHYYGICLKNNKKYNLAKENFNKAKIVDSTHFYNNLYLESIDSLIIWDTNKVEIEVENISSINSSLANYSPRYYKDGLLYCSEEFHDSLSKRKRIDFSPIFEDIEDDAKRKIMESRIQNELTYGSDLSPRTSLLYVRVNNEELFKTNSLHNIPENSIEKQELVAANKKINIGSYFLDSNNGNILYTNTVNTNTWNPDINKHSILYSAKLDQEKNRLTHKKITKIKRQSSRYGSGDPTLSSDGNIMYFVSDKPGGEGGADIYFVKKNKNGKWGKAINLGSNINTKGNEISPFIYNDEILYFSSDGYIGYGGLDILSAKIFEDSIIKSPEILSYPLNSSSDETYFSKHPINEHLAVFTSNRFSGQGDDDIYFAYFSNIPTYIAGYVLTDSGTVQEGAIVRIFNKDNEEIDQLTTMSNGKYRFELEDDKNYNVIATINGYAAELSIETNEDWKGNEDQNLILLPTTTIQGTVTDENGNPISDSKLELYDIDDNLILTIYSDENGKYQFKLEDNEKYLILAFKDDKEGDVSIYTSEDYSSDTTNNIVLRKVNTFVEGRVLDENGNPVSGAIVRLLDSANTEIERITTDEDGTYYFAMNNTHNYRVIATKEGLVDDLIIKTGQAWNENEKKDLVLIPHLTAQGITLDENGNVVGDVKIDLFDKDDNRVLTIFSNEEGYYQLPLTLDSLNKLYGRKDKSKGNIEIFADSLYDTHSQNNIVLINPENEKTLVAGIVRDQEGNPVPGARVELHDENGKLIATIMTDEEGKYQFTIDKNTNYQILASIIGFEGLENIYTGDKWNKDELLDITLLSVGETAIGEIVDHDTGETVSDVKISLTNKETEKKIVFFSDEKGVFEVKLIKQTKYFLKLEHEGYYPKTIELDIGDHIPKEIDMTHLAIESSDHIVSSINFDYDKFSIKQESLAQLDILIQKLREEKDIKIEISSYADCRGNDDYNNKLTQKRGNAVKKYFLKKGVNSSRIIVKSYGATHFVNNCYKEDQCTEKEHGLNRRSEFQFIRP